MREFLKKCWRFVRKCLALIGAVILVAILAELFEDNGWRWRGIYYARNHTKELPYGCREVVKHGKMRILDAQGKTIIRRINYITYSDSMAVVQKDHKRGYINLKQGRLCVKPQYEHAWVFGCGLGAVVKDNKVGFIDAEGNTVIPFRYPYYRTGLRDFVFKGGHCAVADSVTGKIGIIDMKGEWAIRPEYDKAVAREDGAEVYNKGGWKQLIAYDGTLLRDHMIDYTYQLDYTVSAINRKTGEYDRYNFILPDVMSYRVCGLEGLMTTKGEFLTPPVYADIEAVSANLFRAQLPDDGAEILIDAKGHEIK